jgi:hypothetical protein
VDLSFFFNYSLRHFPAFALTQKVEPKSQGCPDVPPGSPAHAQHPRATGRIFHFESSLSSPHSAHFTFLSCCLSIVHQVYQSLGAEFRSVSYNYSLQHHQRNEALDQSLRLKNVQPRRLCAIEEQIDFP